MRKLLLVSAAALLLPVAAMAQNTMSGPAAASSSNSASGMSSLSDQDKTFVQQAAMAGMAEVKAGNIAESKGNTAAVRGVARRMVTDHTKLNDQLKTIAQSNGCKVPTNVSSDQSAMISKLNNMSSGSQFDTAYLQGQKQAHEQAITLFQQEESDGTDSQLKTFATKAVPVLQMHLKMIESAMK